MLRTINGHRVNTVSFGSGGVPFVGISGSIGTWEIWRPPFELLSADRLTISYDHLGAGDTLVEPEVVTFENQVELVGGLLDSFELAECTLAGDSSMAAVAVEAAIRWPDRISSLILVSAGIDFAPTDVVRQFVAGLRQAFDPTVKGFVDACLPEDERGELKRMLFRIISNTGGERSARLLEMFYEVDIRSRLDKVTQPTLIVHGARDIITTSPLAGAEEMASLIPDAKLVVLPDTGHVPTLSAPYELVAQIGLLLG